MTQDEAGRVVEALARSGECCGCSRDRALILEELRRLFPDLDWPEG